MARPCCIFLLLFLSGCFPAGAQKRAPYASKWQLRPQCGYYLPANRLLRGDDADYLLTYSDRTFYVQALSIAYFFQKRWGAEFNYQGSYARRTSHRGDNFGRAMQDQYGAAYYVSTSTGADYRHPGLPQSAVERGYLGVVYRVETDRWYGYPKVSIGVTSFFTDWGTVYLKEKNTNRVVQIAYNKRREPHDQFTIATSAAIGYKLANHLYLNIDLLGTFYRTHTAVRKTITDLNTKVESVEVTDYSKGIATMGAGAGFVIVLQ